MARDAPPKPRLCHLRKWPDFAGYGFNLHAEKGRSGHFVGRVDEGSPAAAGGLCQGDRIVEVNGTNIGNENHQQVVTRIQLVPHETRILVVDPETDEFYRKNRVIVRSDMLDVQLIETPSVNPFTKPPVASYKGKLCELKIWSNFIGYGFNLHAEKGNPSHIVGRVDPKSPAEATGMKEGDRILEVNGVSVLDEPHADVVKKIKSDPRKVTVLLVSRDCETFLREQRSSNPSELLEIGHFVCPDSNPFIDSVNTSRPVLNTAEDSVEQGGSNNGLTNLTSSDTKDSSSAVTSCNSSSSAAAEPPRYRLCHMKRSEADAKSFGFTMHASKGQAGHFITEVDLNSIAEHSGLRTGDRVIEVNGVNVEAVDHKKVVDMIRTVPNETFLLVINDFKDHDCWTKSNKADDGEVETEESNKNKTNISSDYRRITDEMIEVAEKEAKTHEREAAKKSAKAMTSPMKNYSSISYESSLNSNDDSKSEDSKRSPVIVSGIEFASSAEEARRRMKKKSRVKEENLSIKDKFRLFEKL